MAQSTAHRRLLQEYRALTNNPPDGITAGPVSEDDLLHWEALIQGPEGTPFEGGVFPAELKFPKDYPLAPPSMKFLGEIFHPNGMWSPQRTSEFAPPCPSSYTDIDTQCTRAVWCVSQSCTHLATTRITMNMPRRDGARFRVSRRF